MAVISPIRGQLRQYIVCNNNVAQRVYFRQYMIYGDILKYY